MRVAPRRDRLTLAAACLGGLLAWAIPASTQAPADIGIAAYRRGDVEAALQVFNARPRAVRDGAVRQLRESRPVQQDLLAAAMLYTELAGSGVLGPNDSMAHLERAEDLITAAGGLSGSIDIQSFRRAWYPLAAGVFLSRTEPAQVRTWFDRGTARGVASARLDLALGAALEMTAFLREPECGRPRCPGRTSSSPLPTILGAAIDAFREGLRKEPTQAELQLRLGRVLFLAGRFDEAERTLRAIDAGPLVPAQVYLKHLFLADVRGFARDYAGAHREYSAAVNAVPAASGLLGLASTEARLGLVDDSRATTARALAASREDRDPWEPYRFGAVDLGLLRQLREAVR